MTEEIKKEPLTAKEERFCREYFIDFNQTRAHERAGYKAKNDETRAALASKLFRKGKVENRIKEFALKYQEKNELKVARLIDKYERAAHVSISEFVDFGDVVLIEDKKEFHNVIRIKSLDQIKAEYRDLIKRVKKTREGLEIEILDSMQAMEALRKIFGLDAPQKFEHDVNLTMAEIIKQAHEDK